MILFYNFPLRPRTFEIIDLHHKFIELLVRIAKELKQSTLDTYF